MSGAQLFAPIWMSGTVSKDQFSPTGFALGLPHPLSSRFVGSLRSRGSLTAFARTDAGLHQNQLSVGTERLI